MWRLSFSTVVSTLVALSRYNLVPEDQNTGSADVYVYDRDADNNKIFDEEGGTHLDLVSISTDGYNPGYMGSNMGVPMMSGDGRWVVFTSIGLDPGAPDDNKRGFYLRDRLNRTTKRLLPILQPIAGCEELNIYPYLQEITSDGRFILVSGLLQCGTNSVDHLGYLSSYLWDRDPDQDGILDEQGFTNFNKVNMLLSDEYIGCANLSADGRFCIFAGGGSNPDHPDLPLPGVYIHDFGTVLSYSITGRATDGNDTPLPGVLIDAGDGRMAFTDKDGFYFLVGLPGGTYYLKASGNDMTFSPSVRAVVVPPNSAGQDFKSTTGYVPLSSLSGRVTDIYNNPIADTLIEDGNGRQTYTDNEGYYSFTGLPDGKYTLTPSKEGYEFHPQPMPISVQGDDIGGLNYTGLRVFSISGRVIDQNGNGIEGVVVSDNFGNQATTDANGYYTLIDVPAGGHTLTPAKPIYTFSPAWLYIEVISSDATAVDIIGWGP